jgi:hypothetical protein
MAFRTRVEGGELELIELYDALEQQPSSVKVHEKLLKIWEKLGDNGTDPRLLYYASFIEQCLMRLDRYGIGDCVCSYSD